METLKHETKISDADKKVNEKKEFSQKNINQSIDKSLELANKISETVTKEDNKQSENVIDTQTSNSTSELPWIFLDLDSTLIFAVPSSDFHKKYLDKKNRRDIIEKLKSLKVWNMKDLDEEGKMRSYYLVFERPGLRPFLDYIFKNFNVNVWTAASKDYAAFIIDKILLGGNLERNIKYAFVHYHGKRSKKRYGKTHPKELKMLIDIYKIPGITENNCFIVDDHPDVKSSQPKLCVTAPEWVVFDEDNIEFKPESLDCRFLENLQKGLDNYIQEYSRSSGIIPNPSEIIELENKHENNNVNI